MTTDVSIQVGAVVALASGIPLLVLGLVALSISGRGRDAAYFSAAALAWGSQVVISNLGRVSGSLRWTPPLLLFSLALIIVLSLVLVRLGALQLPGQRGRAALTYGWLALAAGQVIALTIAPARFVQGASLVDGVPFASFGDLLFPVIILPWHIAYMVAAGAFYAAYRSASPGSPRFRIRGLFIGVLVYAVFNSFRDLFLLLDIYRYVGLDGDATLLWAYGTYTLAALFYTGLFVFAVLRPPAPESIDTGIVAAFLIPATWAAIESSVAATLERGLALELMDSTSLWRLAAAAILFRTIIRHRMFDPRERLRKATAPIMAATIAGIALTIALVLAGRGYNPAAFLPPAIGGVVLAAATVTAGPVLAERWFPAVTGDAAQERQRRLEAYWNAMASAGGAASPARLALLRRDLGINRRDHELMAAVLQRSTNGLVTTTSPIADIRGPENARQAPSNQRAEPGAVLFDRYRIDRLIGQGAHGRAFLAFDELDDREVVVKVVGTAALGGRGATMLRREAELISSLDHPNLIKVLEMHDGDQEAYAIMEYAEQGSLQKLLRRRSNLPLRDAVAIGTGLLAGLHAAHEAGVVHRDIKPDNVLLMGPSGQPVAKVADFGVAQRDRRDMTGLAMGAAGTLLYMSPEQVRGDQEIGPASDQYAAAVVLYQCLTGQHYLPVSGKDDFQIRQAILELEPALRLPSNAARLEPELRRALAKSPEGRFASCADFAAALRAHTAL